MPWERPNSAAMTGRKADLVPFTVGAVAGAGFTVLVISSADPDRIDPIALPIAMLVGSFLAGGIGSVWLGSGAAVRYLEFWEVPTRRPVRWLVQVLGAIGFASIWALGLFMVVYSLS
jgi:tetrahydromethanopterin S-methyltransferase subunit D